MSYQMINKILTRAMIDPQFAQKLLADPLEAIHEFGFEVTLEEAEVLRNARVKDISELSQLLLAQLGGDGR